MRKLKIFVTVLTCFCILTTGFLLINIVPQQSTEPADDSPVIANQTGYMEIRVRDSTTSDPLPSAVVTVWQGAVQIGTTKYTDSNGFTKIFISNPDLDYK